MNDKEIVELYFLRRDRAIAETERKYGAYLNRIAFNILGSSEDSEEVVQDSYLRAWNSIPPQRPRVLKHFLARISRNLALDRLEYLGAKRRSPEMTELIEELENSLCSAGDSAESQWEQKHTGQLINSFLAGRDKQERGIFVCRYFYSMTYREIGQKLAVPEHRVRYVLQGMRAELKDYLEREGVKI